MAKVTFLVTLTNGQRVRAEATGTPDAVRAARSIAETDGIWEKGAQTYYPARTILSVQIVGAGEDGEGGGGDAPQIST